MKEEEKYSNYELCQIDRKRINGGDFLNVKYITSHIPNLRKVEKNGKNAKIISKFVKNIKVALTQHISILSDILKNHGKQIEEINKMGGLKFKYK